MSSMCGSSEALRYHTHAAMSASAVQLGRGMKCLLVQRAAQGLGACTSPHSFLTSKAVHACCSPTCWLEMHTSPSGCRAKQCVKAALAAPVEDDGEALGGGRGPEALDEGAPHGGAEGLGHALHARPALHLHALLGLARGGVERLRRAVAQQIVLFYAPQIPCFLVIFTALLGMMHLLAHFLARAACPTHRHAARSGMESELVMHQIAARACSPVLPLLDVCCPTRMSS